MTLLLQETYIAVATVMMVVEGEEKIVIAKPVACRPRFSNLKPITELLSVATDASPSAAFTETDVAVVRPTTARFKPDSCATISRMVIPQRPLSLYIFFELSYLSFLNIYYGSRLSHRKRPQNLTPGAMRYTGQ